MKFNKSYLLIIFIFLTILNLGIFYKIKYMTSSLDQTSKHKTALEIQTQETNTTKNHEKSNREVNPTTIDSQYSSDSSIGYLTLKDEIKIDSLPIQGKIPDWLEGTLYRNGPSIFEIEDEKIESWFDGLAMLHKFKFENGKISY